MARLLLEVIVLTVEDAVAAAEGGADRLEVVRAIELGGLTPPLTLVRGIAAATRLPLRVMVRENGGYDTDAGEIGVMQRAAAAFADLGVDGLVVGFARGGEPLLAETAMVLARVPGLRATFHRAFDQLRDPLAAIGGIMALPQIDGILTDGGRGALAERGDRLRQYAARAGDRLRIIAGSGVDDQAIAWFARTNCVREVHVGRAARADNRQDTPVSLARVRRLRQLCDGSP